MLALISPEKNLQFTSISAQYPDLNHIVEKTL